MQELINHAKQQIVRYQSAIDFISGCCEFSFDSFKGAHQLARTNITETELQSLWRDAALISPRADYHGGIVELQRYTLNSFKSALDEAQKLLWMTQSV